MNKQATIIKIGNVRKDGSRSMNLAFEGRRFQWNIGYVGSFLFARCEDAGLTVKEAQASIRTIHDWLQTEKLLSHDYPTVPSFAWVAEGTVANWRC